MTRPMSRVLAALLLAAILATALDAFAYAALITTGHVSEQNELVARMSAPVALWAKGALVVLVTALTVLSCLLASRALRFTVGAVLVVGIVAGAVGFVSTIGAAG